MKIPSYARYDYCNQKACEFLEEFNIITFPVNIESVIHKNKWGLIKYSEIMHDFNCDRGTVIRCLGSKDGYTQYDGNNYTIAYNDDDSLGNRTRFTLMHEVGHIYLGHLTDFEATKLFRGSLTKSENKVLENEANAFARNVLVPTTVLKYLGNKAPYNVSKTFGITESAAKTRLAFYETDIIANKHSNLLSRLFLVFGKFYYKKLCPICGYFTISTKYKYCPICGNDSLKRGDGNMIYNDNIKLDSSSKALECPKCKNEQIISDGEYCKICGTYLVNKCDDRSDDADYYGKPCGHILSHNARFCPYCGNRSTFYNDKILCSWKEYIDSDGFMSIPESVDTEADKYAEIDEELPFS